MNYFKPTQLDEMDKFFLKKTQFTKKNTRSNVKFA